MSPDAGHELDVLLDEARGGDVAARDRIVAAIHADLRRIAAGLMRDERPGHTLQPTALVNEAMIRLFSSDLLDRAEDRRFVLAAATQAMRQVLVDHHRARQAAKRGGPLHRTPLDDALAAVESSGLDVVELHDALDRLAQLQPRQALVVTSRYFLGMSVPEVAMLLGLSVSTVEADWRIARAWLFGQLGGTAG